MDIIFETFKIMNTIKAKLTPGTFHTPVHKMSSHTLATSLMEANCIWKPKCMGKRKKKEYII
jgi:hypothetical protein